MKRLVSFAVFALTLAGSTLAQLELRGGRGRVHLASQTVEAVLDDGLARVSVQQVFRYDGERDAEAVYTFPLPQDASLTALRMTTGGKTLEGVLTERQKARRVYREIVNRERDPALLEKVSDGRFRLSVYPLQRGVDAVIELEYVQRAPLFDGAYSLAVPLGGATAAGATTLATVDVRSSATLGEVLASLDDAYVARLEPGRTVVSYERGADAALAHPVGMTVTARLARGEPSFDVRTFRDEEGRAWFVGAYSPGTPRPEDLLPRDVLLVLDTSGSMKGEKIVRARSAARWLVDHVGEEDRVEIVRFSTDVRPVLGGLQPANEETRERLHRAISNFRPSGSTAFGDALAHTAALPETEGRARTVVLLTDGRPTFGETDPAKLIDLAAKIGDAGLRLSTFGVGDDVDAALLRGCASAARGHAELFASALEIEPRLARFLSRTSAPTLRDLDVSARGVEITAVHPRLLPDAFLGEQVVFAGRLTGHGPAAIELVGEGPDGIRRIARNLMVPEASGGDPSVRLQYATARLADLEAARRLRAGLSEAAYRSAASYWQSIDGGDYSTTEELTHELVQTSLGYGVQCAFTSFIAVEAHDRHRVGGEPEEETEEEPLLEDYEVLDHNEAGVNEEFTTSEAPFDDKSFNDTIGLGGGAGGGRLGGRLGGTRNLRAAGGNGTEQTLKDGLEWLKADLERHPERLPLRTEALRLLAFVGDGHTLRRGQYKDVVMQLTKELRDRFERSTGRFAEAPTPEGHLLATLALTEVYYFDKSPLLKGTATAAARTASAIAADPSLLSDEALHFARELALTAREAGIPFNALAPVEAEIRRRVVLGSSSLVLGAVALYVEPDAHRRRQQGRVYAQLHMAASVQDGTPRAALETWIAADALVAAGDPGWGEFNRYRMPLVLDSQRKDGTFKGSWHLGDEGQGSLDERAAATETTALRVLALECEFRIGR